ncbi:flagellar hook protein FlgE [Ramlibacter pallidus]|uniref:Flagellar hook-basal body complex protein n=1 Tax=Ramlibacter pallidus TaxID=2780087 RepID=A0ABR9S2B0_9BURK|nr:flagellar hook-basal body complex protein [Ramlibacter pallidus]MBE7367187.1 flagellar hook-basal body complex protein [Ramlibacter pallidus]
MLDSIQIGMTGLLGYSKGLRVIANNTTNLNTPGYKTATLQFTDLFYANTMLAGGGREQLGYGVGTAGTTLDFRPGDLRQTGNAFDLGLDGDGLFILRDGDGRVRYTRAGQFDFDESGVLVSRNDGRKVVGVDAAGNRVDLSLAGMRASAGKATASARFTGNLSSTVTEQTVGSVKIHDSLGQEHTLSAKFTSTDTVTPGSWKVELFDGTTSVGTSEIVFVDGRPRADATKLVFTYAPAGRDAQQLTLDFGSDVTSFASGNLSTLAMTSQDGYAPGTLSKATFDEKGTLVATYTNGQTAKGASLLLARYPSIDAIEDLGGNEYGEANGMAWETGRAGEGAFGTVRAGVLEVSNVDLSREFSDLVVMQRGYQASSQVISTANDMLQELFKVIGK